MEKTETAEFIEFKKYLLSYLVLKLDYSTMSSKHRKLLLVEGVTDKKFIGNIINNDSQCLTVKDIMIAKNAFKTTRNPATPKYSSKSFITKILKEISFYPEYYDIPKGSENWPLFGLVDNDFDDCNDYLRVKKLFFTDTHDLETLMLSTDGELLFKLEQCNISTEDVKEAYYLAKQLSAFRKAIIYNDTLSAAELNSSDGTIDFEKFTDGNKISLIKMLIYINSKRESPLPKEKLKKIQITIAKDMKKLLDKNGFWKKALSSFIVEESTDFWIDINGHDILAAIRFKNPSAKKAFCSQGTYKLNRNFEFALSEAYDYNCLKNTKLYQKLHDAGLINL